jgi:hypothetical protein
MFGIRSPSVYIIIYNNIIYFLIVILRDLAKKPRFTWREPEVRDGTHTSRFLSQPTRAGDFCSSVKIKKSKKTKNIQSGE